MDTGWCDEGQLEKGSSEAQELSLALQESQAGFNFLPQKYSGM